MPQPGPEVSFVLPCATLAALGAQTVLASYVYSMLGIRKRRQKAP